MIEQILVVLDHLALWYFLGLNGFYTLLLVLTVPQIARRTRELEGERLGEIMRNQSLPGITIIAPAYDEEATIVHSVTAMLRLAYPALDVIVVNDGSRDATVQRLIGPFDLRPVPVGDAGPLPCAAIRAVYRSRSDPRLLVVDKANGGKADALNAGVGLARSPYVMAIDADTLIETDALQRLVRPMLMHPGTVATGGSIRIVNGCEVVDGRVTGVRVPPRALPAIQVVEYLRAFQFGRLGYNLLGGNLVVSGAFGLFDRAAVIAAGGYLTGSVGEDIELVVRLHHQMRRSRRPYRIAFVPDPVAWTEVPESVRVLMRQRERWHRGLIDSMWRHRAMLGNPRYGMVGLVTMPFFVVGEMLAPLVELLGLLAVGLSLAVGAIDLAFAGWFLLVAIGYTVILNLLCLLLELVSFRRYHRGRDLAALVAWSLVEQLGYRQLTVVARLQAFWRYARGSRAWGAMQRRGFDRKGAS